MLEFIKKSLIKKSQTLAVAESLTAGNLQAMIGSVSWASWFFKGWMTAYTESMKVKHLWVDQAHAHRVNCVSQRVANEMALWVCTLFNSTRGISTTGYAEAWGAFSVPFAHYAIAHFDWNEYLVVDGWKIKGTLDMSRVEMQKFVSQHVIEKYYGILH